MSAVNSIQPKQHTPAKQGAKIGALGAMGILAGKNLSDYLINKEAYKDAFRPLLQNVPKKAKPFVYVIGAVVAAACAAAVGSLLGAGIGKITEIIKNKFDSKHEADKSKQMQDQKLEMHQG